MSEIGGTIKTLSVRSVFGFSVIVGLCCGCLDALLGLARLPIGLASPYNMLFVMGMTALPITISFLLLWTLVAGPVTRRFNAAESGPMLSLGFFFLGLIATYGLMPEPENRLDYLTILLMAIAAAIAVLMVCGRFSQETLMGRRAGTLVLALPLIMIELTIAIWIAAYRVWTLEECLILVGAVALATLLAIDRLLPRLISRLMLGSAAAIVMISPMVLGINNLERLSPYPVNESTSEVKRVILIVSSSLRVDALSAYGNESYRTPAIDGLASDGILFEQAISPSSWSRPSVASIFSGVYPSVHRVLRDRTTMPDSFALLSEKLLTAGFVTGAIGDGYYLPRKRFSQGFNFFEMSPRPRLGQTMGEVVYALLEKETDTPGITRRAIKWIEKRRDEPFFLWINYFDPQQPYAPPDQFMPRQPAPASIGLVFDEMEMIRDKRLVPNQREINWIKELYGGEVRLVDQNVGRLLEWLKKHSMYDDSLVVLVSSHGEELGDRNDFDHGHSMYNELLHVPLIIKLPGSKARQSSGRRVAQRVSTVSLYATILDLCGIEYSPKTLSAGSLSGWLLPGMAPPQESPIYCSGTLTGPEKEVVFFEQYKYIHNKGTGTEELYDLPADPGETKSLHRDREDLLRRSYLFIKGFHLGSRELRAHYGISKNRMRQSDIEELKKLRATGYAR